MKHAQRRGIWIIVGLIAVALLVGGLVLQNQSDRRARDQQQAALRQDASDYKAAVAKADDLQGRGRRSEAVIVIKAYLSKSIDKQNKASALTYLGTVYEGMRDYKSAFAAYQQAEQTASKPTYGTYFGAARSAEQLGDKSSALKYYKLCLGILRGLNPDDVDLSDIQSLENEIATLEKQT